MKRAFVALFISTLITSPVFADECSDAYNGKGASGYLLKDVGVKAADEEVIQGGASLTCGKWTADVFLSYGEEGGTANEWDLSLFYDDTFGSIKFQGGIQYFGVNIDDSLDDARDDFLVAYADVRYPMQLGNLTVGPLARLTRMQAVDELQSSTLLAPGVGASYTITDGLSLGAEWREPFNLSQDYRTTRLDLSLTWQATESLALKIGGEYFKRHDTGNEESVASIGFVFTPGE